MSPRRLVHGTYRAARRVVVAVVGGTIVLVGLALVFLPGPATIVLPLGLAVLAAEFAWARRWLHRLRGAAEQGYGHAASLLGRARGRRARAPVDGEAPRHGEGPRREGEAPS